MNEFTEKRAHLRVSRSSDMEVRIIFCSTLPDLQDVTFLCQSSDISLRGICIKSNIFIPSDSLLLTRITIFPGSEKFLLNGRVAWCKPADENLQNDAYTIGIELEQDCLRNDTWRSAIFALLENKFAATPK